MKTLILMLALCALPACGGVKVSTGVSPVADVANAGGKIEDSAHAILVASQSAQSSNLITRDALDKVALAVNKVGHLGTDLKSGLDAYNALKTAGSDVTGQRASIQLTLNALVTATSDIGGAIPNGTVQSVDQAISTILAIVAQVKAGVGL